MFSGLFKGQLAPFNLYSHAMGLPVGCTLPTSRDNKFLSCGRKKLPTAGKKLIVFKIKVLPFKKG
jgi:hypothetical protein